MLLVSLVYCQKYDPYAKTGNRMCQFAFGTILAKEKNVPFYAPEIPGFTATYNNEKDIILTNNISTINFGNQYVDYNFLLKTDLPICINSYLQKVIYYQNNISDLKQLFYIDNPSINVDKDELVIHIRDTDYRAGNVHIREHVYLQMLETLSPSKVSIVTDNVNSPTVQLLIKEGAKIATLSNETNHGNGLNQHELHDYIYMLKCSKLVISHSTFSWWAALLGDQEKVYVPFDTTNKGMWKLHPKKDDIDLIPTNQGEKFTKFIF